MPHQVIAEQFILRDFESEMASASGEHGTKRLSLAVSHYYAKVFYLVTFNGRPVRIGGHCGLADAIETYNAIDEGWRGQGGP